MTWPQIKLKDCCTVVGGATPRRNQSSYWGHDVPWVTPKDISGIEKPILDDAPEYISQAGFESCSATMLPKGTVLLTSRAPIGNVAIAGREMCTNQGFKSLVPGDTVDSTYLYHCIRYLSPRLQAQGNGATFKEVSKKVVENFSIPLPPLPEQKRIAAILDKADAIRRKRQQSIELADQFLRSVFLDMFGDPVTNPKRWEKCMLGDLITQGPSNGVYKSGDPEEINCNLLDIKGLYRGLNADFSDTRQISVSANELEKFRIHSGDILMNRVSKKPEGVGVSVWVDEVLGDCVYESNMMRFRVDGGRILNEFLVHYLRQPPIRQAIVRLSNIANQASINQTGVRSIPVVVPSMEAQLNFVQVFSSRKKILNIFNHSKVLLNHVSGSLTQRAFIGDLMNDKAS